MPFLRQQGEGESKNAFARFTDCDDAQSVMPQLPM